MEELRKFVGFAVKRGASDIHLVAGALAYVRIHDRLEPVSATKLTQEAVERMVKGVLHQPQMKTLNENGDVDIGVVVGKTSLRINIHRQSRGLAMSIRIISDTIPTPEGIGLSETIMQIPQLDSGLVIISGTAGSGKSTTLASLIQSMNQTSARHIITLEDPIEYRFENAHCLIEQRQLGMHFPNFPAGLRHILRQDPDVIMVGEMRDPETISLALTAAETGHLVLSTLHAPNAAEVVERIVNVFEGSEQQQVLVQLSATLKMVVAQRLVPAKKGGLVAAREIMVSTTAIQAAIRQNNLGTIRSAIQTGKKHGMVSMERALKDIGI
jgi:twitching motility protein PilT